MANNIKVSNPKGMKVYDLKGSLVNRNVTKADGESQTKKDKNLLHCKKNRVRAGVKGILQFRDDNGVHNDIKKLREIIARDSNYLKDINYLDYSILLAIEQIPKKDRI